MARWSGFGLSIESACGVPGLLADATPREKADLRIEMLPMLSPDEPAQPLYRLEDETLIFSAPEVAHYRCRRDWIGIAPSAGADPELVIALLAATALPAVIWMRGDIVLHAAALRTPSGEGFAIAGPSGIGKSTVAAQLLERGAALAADDSVRLHRQSDRVLGNGLAGGFHRMAGSGEQREFCAVQPEGTARDIRLGAILVLTRSEGDAALVRLPPLDGVARLLANQHRPRIPAVLKRHEQTLATISFVARQCRIYEWRRSSPMLSPAEWEMLEREGLC
jgi:hypothetical protein